MRERKGEGTDYGYREEKEEEGIYLVDLYQRLSDDPPRWRVRQSGRELSFPRGTYNSNPTPRPFILWFYPSFSFLSAFLSDAFN